MRFIEVKIDEQIYRLTAHGQTADLYEELYGDDSDILQDLMAYANGNKDMFVHQKRRPSFKSSPKLMSTR